MPPLDPALREQLEASVQVNSAGFDPWGLNLETAERTLRASAWVYRKYFRVEVEGIERVPQGRCMLVPNHSGQLPLDGFLIGTAMALEATPPRVVRGMVERWFPSLPFISTLFTRCGQVVGDPENCKKLLNLGQTIMVFPEGVGGSGKLYKDRYRLQRFGTGFVRLALETRSPIVPIAVVGAEETYPAIYNAASLAKLVGAPVMPVTPFWPLLGPLGAVPIPSRIQLKFGEPFYFEGDPDQPDPEVQLKVNQVKDSIQGMIDDALDERPRLRKFGELIGGPRRGGQR